MKNKMREQSVQLQGNSQSQFQSFSSLSSPKAEMAASSNELSLHIATSGATATTEADDDEQNQTGNPSCGPQASHSDLKGGTASSTTSEDGYNWRKYGQKLVKGKIIYKGTHDHPKPQPSRRYAAGALLTVQEDRSDKILSGRDEKLSGAYSQLSNTMEPNGTSEMSPVTATDENAEGTEDDDDPLSKRRKMDTGSFDVTPVVKPIREPRVVVQTLSEVDILDDGYRWRKYGQKVVRGNPNPRSYYKCTNVGCPVRKHVERASHDPKAVITTYEGKHNHDVPAAKNSSSHDAAAAAAAAAAAMSSSSPLRIIRSDESDTISLDLGVGRGSSAAAENRSSVHHHHQQPFHSEHGQQTGGPSFSKAAIYYGGMTQYASTRQTPSEARSSSYPYPPNMGRILTGP
ncbi:unnamed protein product [Linum tenue]|uniref:WRKY domain-containing protein n=1 Tax=Linum tenue TaxID=586396 RepID=A0AAV0H246_9ROSI|nr:unnamed protein product [Linum tenue]